MVRYVCVGTAVKSRAHKFTLAEVVSWNYSPFTQFSLHARNLFFTTQKEENFVLKRTCWCLVFPNMKPAVMKNYLMHVKFSSNCCCMFTCEPVASSVFTEKTCAVELLWETHTPSHLNELPYLCELQKECYCRCVCMELWRQRLYLKPLSMLAVGNDLAKMSHVDSMQTKSAEWEKISYLFWVRLQWLRCARVCMCKHIMNSPHCSICHSGIIFSLSALIRSLFLL